VLGNPVIVFDYVKEAYSNDLWRRKSVALSDPSFCIRERGLWYYRIERRRQEDE